MYYVTRNKKSKCLIHVACFTLHDQSGQSLIETIIAIFILTSALTAGLGLTIYAFSSASVSLNEITASNLAREGVEVVRMMRDTNWLADDVQSATDPSYDLTTCADIGNKFCFPKAHLIAPASTSYDLSPAMDGNHRLEYNEAAGKWQLKGVGSLATQQLGMDTTTGVYGVPGGGPSVLQTPFYRRIVISHNYGGAYPADDSNSNSELVVQAIVWWTGKNCLPVIGNNPLSTNCKVVVEEHLTNWKDYK